MLRPTDLRFCCASNVVTASEAREPDAYRDCINRLLGTGPDTWFLATESPERTVMDRSEAGEARSDFIRGIAVNVDRGRSDTG